MLTALAQERKSNKLRDYTTMAGPLGVTQLLLFSRSDSGNTTLRVARCPRGPTIHFRVNEYSLCKDVKRAQRNPRGPGKEFLTPPLLVMNNFTTPKKNEDGTPGKVPPHELVLTSMFQSMFPAISAQHTPLTSIKRVLLLNREVKSGAPEDESERKESDYIISVRHYAITTKPVGVSKAIKRLNAAERLIKKSSSPVPGKRSKGLMPNLGKLEDIADFMLDPAAAGYTSESEVDTDAEVEVLPAAPNAIPTEKKKARLASGPEKRAVKLVELGPRMTLEMFKIEEGIGEGKVLWHAYLKKTREEERELEQRWEERNKIKEERKRIQRENVQRKKEEKERRKKKAKEEGKEIESSEDEDEEMWSDYEGSDDEGNTGKEDENENEEEEGEEEEDVEMESD